MNMDLCKLIVERPYKKVYRCEGSIVKLFDENHPKVDIFNEAMETARVEATGLEIPKLQKIENIDGKWAIFLEYKDGKTLEEMMHVDPANIDKYMSDFVDLQLQIQSKKAPMPVTSLTSKTAVSPSERYGLCVVAIKRSSESLYKNTS